MGGKQGRQERPQSPPRQAASGHQRPATSKAAAPPKSLVMEADDEPRLKADTGTMDSGSGLKQAALSAEELYLQKTEQLSPEQVAQSLAGAFLRIFSKSERLGEVLEDEELILDKLKDADKKGPLMSNFASAFNLTKDCREGKALDLDLIDKLATKLKSQKGFKNFGLPYLAFLIFLQGFRVALTEDSENESDFKVVLENYVRSVLNGEFNKDLAELVFNDAGYLMSDEGRIEKLAEDFLKDIETNPEKFSNTYFKKMSYLMVDGQKYLFDTLIKDSLTSEEIALSDHLKNSILNETRNSEIDFKYSQPIASRSKYLSMAHFGLLGSFNTSHVQVSLDPQPSAVQYQTNVTVDNVPQGFVLVEHCRDLGLPAALAGGDLQPSLQDLAKVVSKSLGRVDLHYDKDAAVVSQRGTRLYFSCDLKRRLLEAAPTADHNVIVAFAPVGFYSDPKSLKIVVTSNTKGSHLELPQVLICLGLDNTVDEFLKEVLKHTRSEQSSKNEAILDGLFNAFVASQELFPSLKEQKDFMDFKNKKLTRKSTLGTLVKLIQKPHFSNSSVIGESPIDFIAKFVLEEIISLDFLNNVRKKIQADPVYLRARLSSLLERIILNKYGVEGIRELPEHELRYLLPSYMYVNLETINRIVEVPIEINLRVLGDRIKELDLPIGTRYTAVGYIAQKNTGEYYDIYLDKDNIGDCYTYLGSRKVIRKTVTLNPNKITGVYFARCEMDL